MVVGVVNENQNYGGASSKWKWKKLVVGRGLEFAQN